MTKTDGENEAAAAHDRAIAESSRWAGDTGTLTIDARRALLKLIQGPYLSAARAPGPWSALLADEAVVRSRLHDIFLDLVLDRDAGFAFVRNAATGEQEAPVAVRSEQLTFIDTAMLLVLRQMLLTGEHDGRVIVGRDDVFEQLAPFRTADRDETDFAKRLNASWLKMRNKLRVVHAVSDERVEISPVLRMLVDADQVRTIAAEYERIRSGERDASGAVTDLGIPVDDDGQEADHDAA